jgi:hypothetical protein
VQSREDEEPFKSIKVRTMKRSHVGYTRAMISLLPSSVEGQELLRL